MTTLTNIVAPGNILTASNTATLTNKTISGANNTLTVRMASDVSGTLPIANGGTGTTSTTFANLTTNVTGTLPIANGGTGLTALGTAGQVLTVNAGATALEFAAGGGGGVALTDFSITTSGSPSGNGSLAYNNTTGVFTFTPPNVTNSVTVDETARTISILALGA
jgi:hypothetical protein